MMIVKCHKTFEVYTICYGGQGFRDDIHTLDVFETREEAETYVENWLANHPHSWLDIKICEHLEELGSQSPILPY